MENDNNFLIESKGTLHTFIIQKVKREHFGEYKCLASNSLGREKAEVELTGINSIKSAVCLSMDVGNKHQQQKFKQFNLFEFHD